MSRYRIPYSIKLATKEDREWCRKNLDKLRRFIETRGRLEVWKERVSTEPAERNSQFASYEAKVENPAMLYEIFTCPETRNAVMVGALPCVESMLENTGFDCRNGVCQQNLRRRLGIK